MTRNDSASASIAGRMYSHRPWMPGIITIGAPVPRSMICIPSVLLLPLSAFPPFLPFPPFPPLPPALGQFRNGFPVFNVCWIRSSVLRSPHSLRNASRSRSSR